MLATMVRPAVAVLAATAALLVAPGAAQARAACGQLTDEQISTFTVGMTRGQVRAAGACSSRVWMHDGRLQKRYAAEGGTGELRINYNRQSDGRWTLNNAFWMTPNGAGGGVVGN